MSTTVTVKGQVTIPKSVRELLGIKPGSKVDFVKNENGEIVIKSASANTAQGKFSRFLGHAGDGLSTDEIMALTRPKK